MNLTRRSFLGSLGAGTAAAALHPLAFVSRTAVARTAESPARGGSSVRLNANENAYGPTAQVRHAIEEALTQANRYPDDARREFTDLVARTHRVSADQVAIGCGSVELLHAAARAFTGPKKKLITASPTFEVLGKVAEGVGAQVVRVPLAKNFSHDLAAMRERMGDDTGLVYICNPNNPTASLTPRAELDAFVAQLPSQTHAIIDEAYHHFATDSRDYVSFLDHSAPNDRVIVLRTFSKVHGLAGMRLGYGVGARGAIERINREVAKENANVAVLRGAMAAMQDEASTRLSVKRNAADRTEFMKQAERRRLTPIPSYANFAMMDVGRPVTPVIEQFQKKGVLVGRPFPPLETYLRVSFGRPEDMKAFWHAWDQIPALASRG